jgi:hypothetical protein
METLAPMPITTKPAAKSDATNLVYILGCGHSGSTLLALLLGSHPEACTVGEMRVPKIGEEYLCSCGEPIKTCQFWSNVRDRMAKRGIPNFDILKARLSIHDSENAYVHRLLDPLPRGTFLETVRNVGLNISPAWHSHLRDVHHRNKSLMDALFEITGARMVIDSSKIAIHLRYLLKSPELRIKIIFLVRDGRAVATSQLGHGFTNGDRRETIEATAWNWIRSNDSCERVLAEDVPAEQKMFLRYEDLCQSPEGKLREVYEFIGLDPNNIVLNFRSKQQHIVGNEMRMKSGTDIKLDERWRKVFTPEDIQVYGAIAGDMLRKYGYE